MPQATRPCRPPLARHGYGLAGHAPGFRLILLRIRTGRRGISVSSASLESAGSLLALSGIAGFSGTAFLPGTLGRGTLDAVDAWATGRLKFRRTRAAISAASCDVARASSTDTASSWNEAVCKILPRRKVSTSPSRQRRPCSGGGAAAGKSRRSQRPSARERHRAWDWSHGWQMRGRR